MARVNRTAPVAFDWCTKCKSYRPVAEFHTCKRRNGAIARQSHCKDCKVQSMRDARDSARSPDDQRKFRTWRPPVGERHHRSKITNKQREEIIRRWSESTGVLAAEFGIHKSRVWQIWRGE
jgi:hypothetical protein